MLPAGTSGGKEEGIASWTFAVLHTSGPDPSGDSVLAFLAMRLVPGGVWEAHEGRDAAAFREFVATGPLIVPEHAPFRAFWEHLEGRRGGMPPCLGLDQLAALLSPGRISNLRGGLVSALLQDRASADPSRLLPPELRAASAQLVHGFLALDAGAREAALRGWSRAREGFAAHDEQAAGALELLDRCLRECRDWGAGGGPLRTSIAGGEAPRLAPRPSAELRDLLEGSEPLCARLTRDWLVHEPLPPSLPPDPPFDARDSELLDAAFREHLPAILAPEHGGDPSACYRESQHRIACEVAASLGTGELLLVHAPTGTGKTLSYLVPALLWARRHGRRVAVATYTRALQEQAMERELPLALRALAAGGAAGDLRAASLKGRDNYLCWRALKLAQPAEEDQPEAWLAWTAMALFGWTDGEGDLDRFPRRPSVALASGGEYRQALATLLADVRARKGCCASAQDRDGCAAELARRRAERAHLVMTNHAFALARPEFFKHVVFDECEHLHDQAESAWSHRLATASARALLASLHRSDAPASNAGLDRLGRQLLPGTPSHASWELALTGWREARAALEALEREVDEFERWREGETARRSGDQQHALLREYVAEPRGAELVRARVRLGECGEALEQALASILERLETMPLRNRQRLRRSLEVARGELVEALSKIAAWLPIEDGRPCFRADTLHDVERDERGRSILVARAILPNEILGRRYYPGLAGAVFLSATTWLAGGFEAAAGYLGLDRAARPAEDEEREARVVRSVRGAEVFDYSRVLVAVPRDVPPVARDKDAYLAWTRRFLAWLGERTRGRILALFTNQQDVRRLGIELQGFFRAREIPFWYQGMQGVEKEELSELFRARADSILLGVDTFWYGADFPGETLEYLVIARLPYGVPDRYYHAQCSALGSSEQRRRIYLPRALAKFRQGFGRLMRRTSDRGVVFVLDPRILEPRHRAFLRELPLVESAVPAGQALSNDGGAAPAIPERRARLVHGPAGSCLRSAFEHMGLERDARLRELGLEFEDDPRTPPLEVPVEDLPF